MTIKEKIKISIFSIWQGILGFISPVCIGVIFMMVTGHGKGYGYDLRGETDFSIMLGIIFLVLWLAFVLPVFIWQINNYCKYKKVFYLIPLFTFGFMFLISILVIGISNFLSFFGI